MTLLSVDVLKTTLRDAVAPTVSIYMPTHPTGPESAQDPIRLENLLKDAARQLEDQGHDARMVERILAPVRARLADTAFWRSPGDGLAVLAWDGGHAVHRVPFPTAELCVTGDRLHVKPLLPLCGGDGRFFLLALSQNSVRLFEGSRDGLRPIEAPEVPASLGEVVGYDVEQRSLQFRTQAPAAPGRARPAQFHGHGVGADDQKEEMAKFLRAVDEGVRTVLGGVPAPIVLAAADPVGPRFRQLSRLPGVLPAGPTGNFDEASARELFDKARPFVQPHFDAARTRLRELVREGLGTGRVVQRIEEVVQAALDGRIEAMFAATDAHRWGRIANGSPPRVNHEREVGDVDLIDVAAAECLLRGGEVHATTAADVPGDRAVVAAVLRY